MPKPIIRSLHVLLVFLCLSCSKEEIVKNKDQFIEEPEQLSELNVEIAAAAVKFIEVQWRPVSSTHFKKVTYNLYLDGQKIVEGANVTSYSFINLEPEREYAIKIEAATEDGVKTSQTLRASTLAFNEADQIIYQKISIHTYSHFLGPSTISKLSDGGHLIVNYLQHPSFRAEDGFKIAITRIDNAGNLLWYRLFDPPKGNLHTSISPKLTLHNNETEGIIIVHKYAFKISLLTSKIILEKDFSDLDEFGIASAYCTSDRQLLIGTQSGSLLSINPTDLSIIWRVTDKSQRGAITAIITDSRRNIYTSFIDQADPINGYILKFSSAGEYIARFQIDQSAHASTLLIDEQDNLYIFHQTGDENTIEFYKLKDSGELISKNSIKSSVTGARAFWGRNEQLIVYGVYYGSGLTAYSGIYVFDKKMNILSKRFNNHLPNHGIHALTENANGTLNYFLAVRGSQTSEFIFIKSDDKGNI